MDWTQIIVALISVAFGGGIGVFIIKIVTLNATKKKAEAEAEAAQQQNQDAIVETMKKALAVMQQQLDRANATIAEKDAVIAEKDAQIVQKDARITELTLKLSSLYDDMCVHKGCKLRKPHQGQGQKWYEDHANDPSLGCDYLSVEWLLKQWRKRNAESENDCES